MTPRALALAALLCTWLLPTQTAAQSVSGDAKDSGAAPEAKADPGKAAASAASMEIVRINPTRVRVCVRTEDRGGGVGKVALTANGYAVEPAPADAVVAETGAECPPASTFEFELLPGKNPLEASVFARDGVTKSVPVRDTVRRRTPTDTTTLWILTVGINEYRAGGPARLAYASNDARAFADSLSKQSERLFARIHIDSLYDSVATKDSILSTILQLADSVRSTDTFVFFYAGHGTVATVKGVDMFFLLPVDVTGELSGPRLFLGNGIRASELHESIGLLSASASKLMIFDACNTGALADYFNERDNQIVLHSLRPSTDVGILAATTNSQVANASAKEAHGLFTSALLYNRPEPGDRPRTHTVQQFITQTANAWNLLRQKHPGVTDEQNPVMRPPNAGDFTLLVKPAVPQT